MKEVLRLKTSTILREKRVTFSNFLMFTEDKVCLALGQIVVGSLRELEYQIDQPFSVTNVKINKLTLIYSTYI